MADTATNTTQQYPFTRPDALSAPCEFADLRRRCPVADVRFPGGDAAVVIMRYDDAKHLLDDPRISRNIYRADAAQLSTTRRNVMELEEVAKLVDPPEHTRIRRLFMMALRRARIELLRPRIDEVVDELIDELLAGPMPADAVEALARPLPRQIIGEMFGFPREDWDRCQFWADRMFSLSRHTDKEMAEGQQEFAMYIWDLVEKRRAEPTNDFFSELVAVSDVDDGRLSHIELIFLAQTLFAAGIDSTWVMLSQMIGLLLYKNCYGRVVADPGLIESTVEEVLRYLPPSSLGALRYATEDIELDDTVIPKGTTIAISTTSANRDSRFFDNSDDFLIDRPHNRHITFGYGPFLCPGAWLARYEMQSLLKGLVTRVPTLQLAVDVQELEARTGMMNDGLLSLPVKW
ncbi:cytochrome P450 [Mycobacterium sp. TY815]|uniref:cytochrome P450 n=1 Tax=Mycobacterium sp. TY815 TaxID=3050581 RepID=UPI0027421753|nr:cytochrome P450 [Mycobacterium sp. TY815]MDP7706348.1 cytochrome P450 [Mycobacterium sp. TY815]